MGHLLSSGLGRTGNGRNERGRVAAGDELSLEGPGAIGQAPGERGDGDRGQPGSARRWRSASIASA